MALKISLHTSKREHLLTLAKQLAAALDDNVLTDVAKPVTVSMRGSFSCGKKIFPDMCREAFAAAEKSEAHYFPKLYSHDEKDNIMFPSQIHRMGGFVPNEAEFWSGMRQGRPVEVQLLDAGYILEGNPPRHAAVMEWQQTKENFLVKRLHGGVTFIANDEKSLGDCGIDIWLQSRRSPVKVGEEKDRAGKSPLSKQFNASSDAWSRYIEITVTDERLLNSPRFMQFIDTLKSPDNGYRQHGQENAVQKLIGKIAKKPTVSFAES